MITLYEVRVLRLTWDKRVDTTVGVTAKLTVAVFIVRLEDSLVSHPIHHTTACSWLWCCVVLLGDGGIYCRPSIKDDVIRHMQPNPTRRGRALALKPMAAISRAALIWLETV